MTAIDWYERRHELEPGLVFRTVDGSTVELDQRVPGDGTQWTVIDLIDGHRFNEGTVIEPGDLVGEPITS